MKQSRREIVAAEFISASIGDKTRPYGTNHAVSRGEATQSPGPGTNVVRGFSLVHNLEARFILAKRASL